MEILQLFFLLLERLAGLAQGMIRTYRSFEHTWYLASLRLASKEQCGHLHNFIFLVEVCGMCCACLRLYGGVHISNMSFYGRMQDKTSVQNVRCRSKSRTDIQDFFLCHGSYIMFTLLKLCVFPVARKPIIKEFNRIVITMLKCVWRNIVT